MAFYSTICPECKKEIQVPDDAASARCMYCGANIQNKKPVSVSVVPNINNLLGLARTALAANNVSEAEKYYTQVLEYDPSISEAWFGKGKSAGLQSTLNNIRLNDAIVSFKNAVGSAPDNEKNKMLEDCITEINNLAVTIYGMADRNMQQFVSLPNIYNDYVTQMMQLINALDEVAMWAPNNKVILENIIHFCKVLIEGIQYRDEFDNNVPKAWNLTPEYEKLMRDKISTTSEKIKSIDPNYIAPNPEAKKAENCFVITATLGDSHHPSVCLLRRFRDEWLIHKNFGKNFIIWYYKNGPSLANIIRNNKLLRKLSYYLIVIPATKIAKIILK